MGAMRKGCGCGDGGWALKRVVEREGEGWLWDLKGVWEGLRERLGGEGGEQGRRRVEG